MVKFLVPVAVLAAVAVSLPAQAVAAPQAVGDVQLASIDAAHNSIDHTIRYANGHWQPFGQLTGEPGIDHLTSVIVNGQENLFFRSVTSTTPTSASLHRLVRFPDGHWENSDSVPGSISPYVVNGLAATELNGSIAIVANQGGFLSLTTLESDGLTWSQSETVPTSGNPLTGYAVSSHGGVLRVVEATDNGTRIGVYDRTADGRWSAGTWTDTAVTPQDPAGKVVAAQVGDTLQIVTSIGFSTGYELYYSALHADGTWEKFQNIDTAATTQGCGSVINMAATASGNTMQLAVTSQGFLCHTIHFTNGTWQRFGDVRSQAGPMANGEITLAAQN